MQTVFQTFTIYYVVWKKPGPNLLQTSYFFVCTSGFSRFTGCDILNIEVSTLFVSTWRSIIHLHGRLDQCRIDGFLFKCVQDPSWLSAHRYFGWCVITSAVSWFVDLISRGLRPGATGANLWPLHVLLPGLFREHFFVH